MKGNLLPSLVSPLKVSFPGDMLSAHVGRLLGAEDRERRKGHPPWENDHGVQQDQLGSEVWRRYQTTCARGGWGNRDSHGVGWGERAGYPAAARRRCVRARSCRKWGHVNTAAGGHHVQERHRGRVFLRATARTKPAHTLMVCFWPPEQEDNTQLFLPPAWVMQRVLQNSREVEQRGYQERWEPGSS